MRKSKQNQRNKDRRISLSKQDSVIKRMSITA